MSTIIKNVMVYDGLGAAPILSDICISGGKIAKNSRFLSDSSGIAINGEGLSICPGFIDLHSHSDLEAFRSQKLNYAIRQGITTEIVGQDGISAAPGSEKIKSILYKELKKYAKEAEKETVWQRFSDYLGAIKLSGNDTRIESLIGYNTVKMLISGSADRRLTGDEAIRMRTIIGDCMAQGSKGLSVSLADYSSSAIDENEIIQACKAVAEQDGIVMMYFGDGQQLLLETIDKAARVSRKSKARTHISQLKAVGYRNTGKAEAALSRLDKYWEEGIAITYDCYPYVAMNSCLSILLGEYAEDINSVFNDYDIYIKALIETNKNIELYGGEENIIITSSCAEKSAVGKRLSTIREKSGVSAAETVMNLIKCDKETAALFFSISNDDLELMLKHRLGGICTDGVLSEFPHPRVYGTFPRFLGNYSRKLKLFSMEEAIKKVTSEPAKRLRLWDRGIIREGMTADLVLFDAGKIKDTNSYLDPCMYPCGIKAVWVEGDMKYAEL